MRIIVAAIVGGIIMFMWGWFSHGVKPLPGSEPKNLPNEEAMVALMKQSGTEPGMYMFPGMESCSPSMSADEKKAVMDKWSAKYEAGPHGTLVYSAGGEKPMSPGQMGTELASNVIAALIGAIVLMRVAGGFGARVLAALAFGLVGWLSISVSHWNWYSFPTQHLLGEAYDQVPGWLLAGIVMAAIAKPKAAEVVM